MRQNIPPIVMDMITALFASGDRSYKDNVATRLEYISEEASRAAARYRRETAKADEHARRRRREKA